MSLLSAQLGTVHFPYSLLKALVCIIHDCFLLYLDVYYCWESTSCLIDSYKKMTSQNLVTRWPSFKQSQHTLVVKLSKNTNLNDILKI